MYPGTTTSFMGGITRLQGHVKDFLSSGGRGGGGGGGGVVLNGTFHIHSLSPLPFPTPFEYSLTFI